MKKIVIALGCMFVIYTFITTCAVAQETARVSTRQIGPSVYFYKVSNLSNNPIASLMIGYNCNFKNTDIEESELTIEPVKMESPTGWNGYPVFVEESNYLHIDWQALNHTYAIQSGSSLDGFIVHMPQSYDLMKQAYFTVFYSAGKLVESCAKVEIDTSTPILFDGKGQRPADVNSFLSYLRPMEAQTTLLQGQTTYYLLIFYGKTILPETFKATLNGTDIKTSFNPKADSSEAVKLNLQKGRNTLILSGDGIRDAGKKATDTDRLVFVVP